MSKSAEAFRTIAEVSELLDVPTHVLRFWESKFTQIKPVKRAGGRRYYRPADVALIAGIKHLVQIEGLALRDAQKRVKELGVKKVALLAQVPEAAPTAAKPPAPLAPTAPEAEQDAPFSVVSLRLLDDIAEPELPDEPAVEDPAPEFTVIGITPLDAPAPSEAAAEAGDWEDDFPEPDAGFSTEGEAEDTYLEAGLIATATGEPLPEPEPEPEPEPDSPPAPETSEEPPTEAALGELPVEEVFEQSAAVDEPADAPAAFWPETMAEVPPPAESWQEDFPEPDGSFTPEGAPDEAIFDDALIFDAPDVAEPTEAAPFVAPEPIPDVTPEHDPAPELSADDLESDDFLPGADADFAIDAPLPEPEAEPEPQDEAQSFVAPQPPKAPVQIWNQPSLFDAPPAPAEAVVPPEAPPEPAAIVAEPEPAPEAEAPIPEAPIALDVEPPAEEEPDPLARVVSLILGGTAPQPSGLSAAPQIDPQAEPLRAMVALLPNLNPAALSPMDHMRLLSARDRLVALQARLAKPPRAPKH